jgi:hypothetical protein
VLKKSFCFGIACMALLASAPANIARSSTHGFEGFIVVNPDGTEARGSAGYSSSHVTNGQYEIDTISSVQDCAFSVTEGSSDSTAPVIGFATAVGRGAEDTMAVMVATYDANGQFADRGFHLIVRC